MAKELVNVKIYLVIELNKIKHADWAEFLLKFMILIYQLLQPIPWLPIAGQIRICLATMSFYSLPAFLASSSLPPRRVMYNVMPPAACVAALMQRKQQPAQFILIITTGLAALR
jgi:hypothetical protein